MSNGKINNIIHEAIRDDATALDLSNEGLRGGLHLLPLVRTLEWLSLKGNQLSSLPDHFENLQDLVFLDLSDNCFEVFPLCLLKLRKLKDLNMSGNPRLLLPPEIAGNHDAQLVFAYIQRTRDRPKRPLNQAKLLLVGQPKVGKTSLVKRLIEERCDPTERMTEGVEVHPWQVRADQTHPVRVNIWDFGGQEIMHATHQFFLTKRSLYLLVADARAGEQQSQLEYWLRIIKSFAADSPIACQS